MTNAKATPQTPADIAALVAQLADLADRLTALLTQETELVRSMRIKEIGPLQAPKTHLTAEYQTAFARLTTARDGKSLPTDLRDLLAVSGQRLATAVAENQLALRVGKTATEKLISSIVDAVRNQQKSVTTYAAKATPQRHGFMTAAAIDRKL